jgi:hypothetical protein
MAANILKSDRAIQMSLFVVRAFVKMRRMLSDTRNLPGGWQGLKRNLRSGLMCMSLPL